MTISTFSAPDASSTYETRSFIANAFSPCMEFSTRIICVSISLSPLPFSALPEACSKNTVMDLGTADCNATFETGLTDVTFARTVVFFESTESLVHSKTIVKGCELCAVNAQVVGDFGFGGCGEGAGSASILKPLSISSKGDAEAFAAVLAGAALAGVDASNASSKPVADDGVATDAAIGPRFEFN